MVIEPRGDTPSLLGRRVECEALDQLLKDARTGRSGVVVLRGEPGVGKTALLGYLSHRLGDWRVVTASGVESELELAYSSLHQICSPLFGLLERLPDPQREALGTVFALTAGQAPDPFLVGLATLTLFNEAAEQQPLACIIDDAQWLDAASARVLAFVARRLLAECVALVGAARTGIGDTILAGLPELQIRGLGESDARALLLANLHGRFDAAVADQLIAECRGNPLALLELPRAITVTDLAGGFRLPGRRGVPSKIEASYAQRLEVLPADAQLLMLAAAAEPLGDPMLLHHAAGTLGIDVASASYAEDAQLLTIGRRVEFAHPLVRSAAYRSASIDDYRRVHHALGTATDAEKDPDRRAWHFAQAAGAPDEAIALELVQSAGRAQGRGGVAAAAAFLERAVDLTIDPVLRAERALAAAEASVQAAAFDRAHAMLGIAQVAAMDELQRSRIQLLRGRIAAASSYGSAAAELLKAAKILEPLDPDLARATYLEAWGTALAAGDESLRDVSKAASNAPPPAREPSPSDVLLDGLAQLIAEGLEAAAPTLRNAVDALRNDPALLRWGVVAAEAAFALWDIDAFNAIGIGTVREVRDAGAFGLLATCLQGATLVATWSGDFTEAASLVTEAEAVAQATGVRISPFGGMLLAAYRGRDAEATQLMQKAIERAEARGEGLGVQYARWSTAVLSNGLGRYGDAMASAHLASNDAPDLFVSHWALAELVEAAARIGNTQVATEAATRLVAATDACDTDWAAGIAARSHALATDGEAAEAAYLEAIARLRSTSIRPELARAHLVYGEWLRRQQRRIDARGQLSAAYAIFEDVGMEAFAERARRELMATGERVRKRTDAARDDLTPQENQIARLASDGQSNRDIAARLYLSDRTVEWHLQKVFVKLGVRSRKELKAVLP